jgi:thioesterase domain-containing protein
MITGFLFPLLLNLILQNYCMHHLELEKYLQHQIPLVETMGVRIIHADENLVEISAPLEPNRNHLGTAFGGSSYSISVLACYTWLFNTMKNRNLNCHVVIKSGQIRYVRPVKDEIVSTCHSPGEVEFKRFLSVLERKKKSQIRLQSTISSNSNSACEFEGEFVVNLETIVSNS